jgi:hypothetical protein
MFDKCRREITEEIVIAASWGKCINRKRLHGW